MCLSGIKSARSGVAGLSLSAVMLEIRISGVVDCLLPPGGRWIRDDLSCAIIQRGLKVTKLRPSV